MRRIKAVVAVAVLALGAGCSGNTSGGSLIPLNDESARAAFNKLVTGVSEKGMTDFCERSVRDQDQCKQTLEDSFAYCLLPKDKPRILRSAALKRSGNTEDGWVLEVAGLTMDGQQYVSEILMISFQGRVHASIGVYWTGLGVINSPFGPKNTKIPQNACPENPRPQ
ncbi:hypothetical protein ACSDR0_36490 [Streptosporangium sp. G11]|uniref:hypothetical protein n=1 Tax=Streptosporangium sp. G11 TaxID=3436926 RepID=UPI003EB90C8B